MVTITIPGIQKLIELDNMAYDVFTTNTHELGFNIIDAKCSLVVYHPKNIGVNDISAGSSHTFANMKNTVRCVMYNGYSNGRTIAKYLLSISVHRQPQQLMEFWFQ